MRLETIFKLSLVFLLLVVLYALDVETEVLNFIVGLGLTVYVAYTYVSYRRKILKKQAHLLVLKSNNWLPAFLWWVIIAAMVLKNQTGAMLYVNAVLFTAVAILTALRETTEAYVVDHTGIKSLKSSKFIAADKIVEVVTTEEAITVRTKSLEDQLTILRRKLKSPDFNQATAMLNRFPNVLKEASK